MPLPLHRSCASASLLCRRRWDSLPPTARIASAVRCARILAVSWSSMRTRAMRIRSASESCRQHSGRPSDAPRPDSNRRSQPSPSLPHLFCLPRHDADLHLSSGLAPRRPLAHLSMFQAASSTVPATDAPLPAALPSAPCTIALFRPLLPFATCLSLSLYFEEMKNVLGQQRLIQIQLSMQPTLCDSFLIACAALHEAMTGRR